jgi:8-oxo-dGTP pyrophosphatase MutT (NUDIX family)
VILLRDAGSGIETYLLRRRTSMAFAAGMQAFPGGRVDPRDVSDDAIAWHGPNPDVWAARLSTDPGAARGFVCAAVRETFEEAGVLLAEPNVQPTGPEWESDRQALVDRRLALSELFERRGLAIRSDLLAPWAHWITPRFEERRYDTWFFAAALPEGQQARDVSGEADHAAWMRPSDAIAAAERGDAAMLPPTRAVLDQLAAYRSAAAVLDAAGRRVIETVMPGWIDDGDEVRVLLPGDPGYPGDDRR